MIRNLNFIQRLIRLFGLKHGIVLFFKLKFKNTRSITLPGIIHPFTLRKGTSDIPTFKQIFIEQEYAIRFTENPKVIIDAGANIGLFSILIKNQFPEAKLICIEPDTENFETLKKNLSPYRDVNFENFGLWNKETKLKVYDKYNMGKWAMVVEETETEGNVNAISINELMEKYQLARIDILKIDIETSEKIVFSDNYSQWLPKTKMIIIELHDWMEAECAQPFFTAIHQSIKKYTYLVKGENTVIINNDLD